MDTTMQLSLGFPTVGHLGPQGMYYCSVGEKNIHGRDFVEQHAYPCIATGLHFEGTKQEVACSQ